MINRFVLQLMNCTAIADWLILSGLSCCRAFPTTIIPDHPLLLIS